MTGVSTFSTAAIDMTGVSTFFTAAIDMIGHRGRGGLSYRALARVGPCLRPCGDE